MDSRALLLVALLAIPALAAPSAQACAVPCGRIYPLILLQVEDQPPTWDLAAGAPLVVEAMLTYRFDMVNEGYTVASPNEPVVIRFEYPRKPSWVDLKVEPEAISVDVNNPTYARPDPSEPTNPQASFVFTTPITITARLIGQPVLKDGYDFAKLLVFAKSSESGLYQSGYGIKEVRVVPEGAVHESDVAGQRDVFEPSPLPTISLATVERKFGGTSVRLEPGTPSPRFWEPTPFTATVTPAPAGRMVLALHDEAGALIANTPAVDSSTGTARLNATLVRPGLHTATLTLLPTAGSSTPPLTYALDLPVGSLDAQGHTFPKSYVVSTSESVPVPVANSADPLTQFERDIPFFAFESAQSASASLTLVTPAPLDLGRSLTNLQFAIHDPDGNMLQAGSVDPTKPTWSLRVGSLPAEGWYVLRVKGVGAPTAARYDANIEVNYAAPATARNRADGVADITGSILPRAGANLTLPTDGMAVWRPSDATPALDTGAALTYTLTIYDANGTLAYASGIREGAAHFSTPAPGTYRAFAYVEPRGGATPFSPRVGAFSFTVGTGETTVAATNAIEDAFEAPFAATETLLGYHVLRSLPGASAPTLEGGGLIDAEGNAADGTAPGTYYVRVQGRGDPPAGSALTMSLTQSYATPVSHAGPDAGEAVPTSGLRVPGVAFALTLAILGALAVAVAIVRR